MAKLIKVAITTDAAGAFSTTIAAGDGAFVQYRYVPHASTPLDTGADLDIVGATSGFVYVNQDDIGTSAFSKAPRIATHDVAGVASLYAATGEPVESVAYVAEPLTITIAQGGNTLSGTLYIWLA